MSSIPGRKRQVEEDDILDWFGWDYDELKNDPNIALGTVLSVADRSECSGFDKVLYMESNALILKGTWKGREAAFKVSRDNENAWNEIAALTAMEGDNHCVEALSWYTVTTWGNDGVGEVHSIPAMSNSGELRDYMEQLLEAIVLSTYLQRANWLNLAGIIVLQPFRASNWDELGEPRQFTAGASPRNRWSRLHHSAPRQRIDI
uniref:Uncharacterized protein n=1 Tax=Branchiostoma floridae TaxID=7739 RepID=C3YN68_BRAFL|eukprot:XP_002602162.1 hypothetical protein BRAFLDRAFT_97977 [Branchiostoma floridae]